MAIIRNIENIRRIKRKEKKVQTSLRLTKIGKRGVHTFFGYYDISPFNGNNDILYLEYYPSKGKADIISNNIDGTKRCCITSTHACNWQQGCRLRWFPGKNDTVIFNDFIDGKHVSRIINTNTGEERKLKKPLYDISPDGSIGITIDFTRLGYMRPGYGYTNLPFVEADSSMLSEGIDIVDVSLDKVIKTVSYADMAKAMNKEVDTISNWYLNHLSFSPDGSKFLFFFLERLTDTKFTASMMYYDLRTGELKLLEPELKNSHYTWLDNDTIVCTAYTFEGEKVYCKYYKYDIQTCKRFDFCPNSLNRDGHPSVLTETEVITDTYPDSNSFQTIYKVDFLNDSKTELIKVFNRTADTAEQRTDLHPRLNKDKSSICFDANINKYRNLFILNIK